MLQSLFRQAAMNTMFGGRNRQGNRAERNAVGIPYASFLTERQFDLLLTVLLAALALNILSRSYLAIGGSSASYYGSGNMRRAGISLAFAPVTSFCLLFMIYLHYEEDIRGKSMLKNWNRRYTFHPAKILYGEKQYHRLVTGQIIHGSKFHLYMNMASLAVMGHEECLRTSRNNYDEDDEDGGASMPMLAFLFYFAVLVVACGVVHVYLVKWFKPDEMYTYSVGFSGVLFALKTLENYDQTGLSMIGIPLFGDVWSFSIPISIPTFTLHWCELFLISVIMPRASFWGHLSGIVTGYLFALLWNIKRLLGVLVHGKVSTSKPQDQKRLMTQNGGWTTGPIQDPLHPGWGSSQIGQNCREDFRSTYGLDRDNSVISLCTKWSSVLDLKRVPFRAPAGRFDACMSNYISTKYNSGHSSTIISMDYYDSDEDGDEESDDYKPRGHESPLHERELDAVAAVKNANEKLLRGAKDCTLSAFQSHCEFREFFLVDLFRANFTLDDRLGKMVEVESKCKKEAKDNIKKTKTSAVKDTRTLQDKKPTPQGKSQKFSAPSRSSTPSPSSTLRNKMKTAQVSNGTRSNINKVIVDCVAHVRSLEKVELGQRIGGNVTVWKSEDDVILSQCAKQATYNKCIELSSFQTPSSHKGTSPEDSKDSALKCILQAVETDFRKFTIDPVVSTPKSEKGDIGQAQQLLKVGWNKSGAIAYLKDNGLALLITLCVLIVARRFVAPMNQKSDQQAERENDSNTVGTFDDVDLGLEEEEEEDEDLYSGNISATKEDTAADASSKVNDDDLPNKKDTEADNNEVNEDNQETQDINLVSQDFKDALEWVLKANYKEENSTLVKASKVIEKLVINATTKGQESTEEDSVKYRCIRAFNPSLKKYTNLKGVIDVLVAFGFERCPKKDAATGANILYLEFPLGNTGPTWMEEALREMRAMRIQEAGLKAGLARKEAANAALKRFDVSENKKKESKAKTKSKKFSAGMGGGQSNTLFYPGGT